MHLKRQEFGIGGESEERRKGEEERKSCKKERNENLS